MPSFMIKHRQKLSTLLFMLLLIVLVSVPLQAQYRFPRPEFKADYEIPELEVPDSTPSMYEYVDLFVLVLLLSLVSYLALKRRSRIGIFFVSIFSLVYLGFIRQGCICPIGSIQNVTLDIFDPSYVSLLVGTQPPTEWSICEKFRRSKGKI